MVTGGDRQILEDIPERLRSAPTTASSSVNTIASLAAARYMEVATVDIKQAYLNADILCNRNPEFRPFMHANRRVVLVKPLKAQYGCVESAKLWYKNHISNALVEQGFSFERQTFRI